VNEDLII